MGPATLPPEAGARPDPPRLETFDYGEVNAARRALGVRHRNETLIGVGLLVGFGALLLGAALLEPDRGLIGPGITYAALLLSLALVLFLVHGVTSYPLTKRRDPQTLTLGPSGFTIEFTRGPSFTVRWDDPDLLIRILDPPTGGSLVDPDAEPSLAVSRVGDPWWETLLLERLPRGATDRILAVATSRGLEAYRERFRITGKGSRIVDEIQLRGGPPIDTEVRGFWSVQRVRISPAPS